MTPDARLTAGDGSALMIWAEGMCERAKLSRLETAFELRHVSDLLALRADRAALVADVDALKHANTALHRRAQSAEAGLRKALDARYTAGERNFGRVLANSAATMYRAQNEALVARLERAEGLLRRAGAIIDDRGLHGHTLDCLAVVCHARETMLPENCACDVSPVSRDIRAFLGSGGGDAPIATHGPAGEGR